MDFITDLPESSGCKNILVLTDRLSKGVILEPCDIMDAPTLARIFLKSVYSLHGLPRAIVSDRGPHFVGDFWTHFCELLNITCRLSTSFHPETDGSTERANATVEAFLRTFCTFEQDNWSSLLPMAQLAMNNQYSASTGVIPIILDHGYHVEPLDLPEPVTFTHDARNPKERAEAMVQRMKDTTDVAIATMGAAQAEQEKYANRSRGDAPMYKPGDRVCIVVYG